MGLTVDCTASYKLMQSARTPHDVVHVGGTDARQERTKAPPRLHNLHFRYNLACSRLFNQPEKQYLSADMLVSHCFFLLTALILVATALSYQIEPSAMLWRSGQTLEDGIIVLEELIGQALLTNNSEF